VGTPNQQDSGRKRAVCIGHYLERSHAINDKKQGGGSPARVTVFRRFKYSLHLHSRIRQCYFDLAVLQGTLRSQVAR